MATILKIMADRYNTGPGVFNPITVLWASELAADDIGVDATKAELKKLNRQREKLGLPVAVHEYGHRLF